MKVRILFLRLYLLLFEVVWMNSFWILFCFTDLTTTSGSYVSSCYYYLSSLAHLPSSKTLCKTDITGICGIVATIIEWLPTPLLRNNSPILVWDTEHLLLTATCCFEQGPLCSKLQLWVCKIYYWSWLTSYRDMI